MQSMKDIVCAAFLEMHEEEHRVRSKPEECPCCELSTDETMEAFRLTMVDEFLPKVESFMEQWSRLGYPIANREDVPEGLTGALVDTIMKYVKPYVPQEAFIVEDIQNHPYVIEKYNEVKNKK